MAHMKGVSSTGMRVSSSWRVGSRIVYWRASDAEGARSTASTVRSRRSELQYSSHTRLCASTLKNTSMRATDTLPLVVSRRWRTMVSHWLDSRCTSTLPAGRGWCTLSQNLPWSNDAMRSGSSARASTSGLRLTRRSHTHAVGDQMTRSTLSAASRGSTNFCSSPSYTCSVTTVYWPGAVRCCTRSCTRYSKLAASLSSCSGLSRYMSSTSLPLTFLGDDDRRVMLPLNHAHTSTPGSLPELNASHMACPLMLPFFFR
mmetsp:Transcript_15602/g.38831  ORF Transcript_15602/g.38831 Transcript_15602/m.38831 type:complete len:258 (-) Transcript_15602:266-1039(-)